VNCDQRVRLRAEYYRKLDSFSDCVDRLPTLPGLELILAGLKQCNLAKEKCAAAREALVLHIQEHNCEVMEFHIGPFET
jgi:hypothetical protein